MFIYSVCFLLCMILGYTLASVVVVSLVSFVGLFALSIKRFQQERVLLIMVSLSAGTLFGDAFLHLLPESVESAGFNTTISFTVLAGVLMFFVLEKLVHWHHCHGVGKHLEHTIHKNRDDKKQRIVILNFAGDGVHNFMDGLIIAGSYLVSIPTGIATTIAVIFHEIPQEIADFGVLVYAGMSKPRALFFNFLSGATAIVGAVVGYMLGTKSEIFLSFILPFAAGGFVYIAGSNLIPELHKTCDLRDSLWHVVAFVVGIALMLGLLLLE